jgi:hypothetical protein
MTCRRWDRGAVAGDDLRLEGKDLAAVGIDQHLDPVHVVVAVLRVIAEGFDAREILEPRTVDVEYRTIERNEP